MDHPYGISVADAASVGGTRIGLISGLAPAWHGASIKGVAFTVAGVTGDNLVLHRALSEAGEGSVLVAALSGDTAAGHWGEIMCVAAAAAGIKGLVISGAVRDVAQIEARGFPVFHVGVDPRPASKTDPGELGCDITIRGVRIAPGDLVLADTDGVAVIPRALIDGIMADVSILQSRETEVIEMLERGMTTLQALGIDPIR